MLLVLFGFLEDVEFLIVEVWGGFCFVGVVKDLLLEGLVVGVIKFVLVRWELLVVLKFDCFLIFVDIY